MNVQNNSAFAKRLNSHFQQRTRHNLNLLKILFNRLISVLIKKNISLKQYLFSSLRNERHIWSTRRASLHQQKYVILISRDLVLKTWLSCNKVAKPKAVLPPFPSKDGNPHLSPSYWNHNLFH